MAGGHLVAALERSQRRECCVGRRRRRRGAQPVSIAEVVLRRIGVGRPAARLDPAPDLFRRVCAGEVGAGQPRARLGDRDAVARSHPHRHRRGAVAHLVGPRHDGGGQRDHADTRHSDHRGEGHATGAVCARAASRRHRAGEG